MSRWSLYRHLTTPGVAFYKLDFSWRRWKLEPHSVSTKGR